MNLELISFKNAQVADIISRETKFPYKPFRVDSKFNNPGRIILTPWPPDGSEEPLTKKEFEERQYFRVIDLVRAQFGKKMRVRNPEDVKTPGSYQSGG